MSSKQKTQFNTPLAPLALRLAAVCSRLEPTPRQRRQSLPLTPGEPRGAGEVHVVSCTEKSYHAEPMRYRFTASTMLQLWALLLGLGYAGVPLLAQLLASLHGSTGGSAGPTGLDQAAALFAVEAIVLGASWALLQRRLGEAAAAAGRQPWPK